MDYALSPPPPDETERRKWQNPEAILESIGIQPGQAFMDIGCGDGFFTVPAAVAVGETGRVYGVDANPRLIDRLAEKARALNLQNIILKAGRAEDTFFEAAQADVIFLGIVLHDFQDPARVLRNARQMIKPTGRLINLDWKRKKMPLGPPFRIRFSEERASRLISEAGFRVEMITPAGQYHYMITARPGA